MGTTLMPVERNLPNLRSIGRVVRELHVEQTSGYKAEIVLNAYLPTLKKFYEYYNPPPYQTPTPQPNLVRNKSKLRTFFVNK